MRKRTIGVAIVAVAAAGFTGPVRGHAAVMGCGTVITTSTTLTTDVGPCNQGGLVIQGSGVTLDLGGHTVSGRSRIGDGVGVLFDHATGSRLTNGTVTGFDAGVQISGGGSNQVDAVFAHSNVAGAKASKDLGDGITIFQSNNNIVTHNTVSQNGPYSGISVVGDATAPSIGSAGNNITFNTVTANNIVASGGISNQDDGIRVEGPNATGTLIQGNTVSQSGLDGIAVFADQGTGFPNTGTRVLSNSVFSNGFNTFNQRKGDGIVLFGSPGSTTIEGANASDVEDNVVQTNANDGIRVASTGNSITGNTATGNASDPGVTAWDLADSNANPPCDANAWSHNTFGTSNRTCIS